MLHLLSFLVGLLDLCTSEGKKKKSAFSSSGEQSGAEHLFEKLLAFGLQVATIGVREDG